MKIQKYIGSRIKEIRNMKNYNQEELAEMLNTTKQTISRYENGDRKVNQDVIFDLSNIFNVSVDDFFPSRESESLEVINSYTYFPTAISAGLPLTIDGITEASKISISDEVLGRYANDKDVFFCRANGDSMNRLFTDGSLLAIKPITIDSLKNGDIVVYSYDSEYSVKHYHKYGDTPVFKPNSTTEHQEHEYNVNDRVKIYGKVITYIVNTD